MKFTMPQDDPLHGVTKTYLRIAEVAEILGISRATVYVEIRRGELKAHYFAERTLRVHVDDLRAYIGSRRTGEAGG